MKRMYVAIAFLLCATMLCVVEQVSVDKAYRCATDYLDNVLLQVEGGDYDEAERLCKELDTYWQKESVYLSAMIDNGQLNSFSVSVGSLDRLVKIKSDSLKYEIISAKEELRSIRDNQRISFGNIF